MIHTQQLVEDGGFARLLTVHIASQTRHYFLFLTVADLLFQGHRSALAATAVMVLSYLPPVFVASRVGSWIDARLSRRLLLSLEALGLATSAGAVAVLAFGLSPVLTAVPLAARAVVAAGSRTAGLKWMKITAPAHEKERLRDRSRLMLLGIFLSATTAGVVRGFVPSANLAAVLGVDVALALVAACLVGRLPQIETSAPSAMAAPESGTFGTLAEVWREPSLRHAWVRSCLAQAVWQGAYTTLVAAAALLPPAGQAAYQVAAGCGLVTAFVLLRCWPACLAGPGRGAGLLFAAAVPLLLVVYGGSVAAALAGMFLLMLAFEIVWLDGFSRFIEAAPREHAGRLQSCFSAANGLVMTATAVAYAALVGSVGLVPGTACYLAASAALMTAALTASGRQVTS